MLPVTRVMIADEDNIFTRQMCKMLRPAEGFCVTGLYQTGIGLIEAIEKEKPDVLLMDLMLPGTSALTILQHISLLPEQQRPKVIIVSSFASEQTIAECHRLGVSFFLRKPVEASSLAELIGRYGKSEHAAPAVPRTAPTQQDITWHIKHILGDLYIPTHVKGYEYVTDCIEMAIEDRSTADSVTKILYPAVAKKNETSWTSVERDIRNAISLAWKRSGGKFKGFHHSQRPANREFILNIVERVRFELQLDMFSV